MTIGDVRRSSRRCCVRSRCWSQPRLPGPNRAAARRCRCTTATLTFPDDHERGRSRGLLLAGPSRRPGRPCVSVDEHEAEVEYESGRTAFTDHRRESPRLRTGTERADDAGGFRRRRDHADRPPPRRAPTSTRSWRGKGWTVRPHRTDDHHRAARRSRSSPREKRRIEEAGQPAVIPPPVLPTVSLQGPGAAWPLAEGRQAPPARGALRDRPGPPRRPARPPASGKVVKQFRAAGTELRRRRAGRGEAGGPLALGGAGFGVTRQAVVGDRPPRRRRC